MWCCVCLSILAIAVMTMFTGLPVCVRLWLCLHAYVFLGVLHNSIGLSSVRPSIWLKLISFSFVPSFDLHWLHDVGVPAHLRDFNLDKRDPGMLDRVKCVCVCVRARSRPGSGSSGGTTEPVLL